MTEGALQDAIRLALRDVPGLVLWRNNVGTALHADGRRVVYGLAPGSADLVGCLDGRFVALEVKTATGRVRPEQSVWLACVRSVGGFAAVVRSVDEAREAVTRARAGARE
ncbi:MAG TPA: VRR-NUC domain-containing protein [Gemmatimonadaceae bacterium]|nr:VRR-NUC domain-containing protein [Gemmatimonadaceae bacterium]